MLKYVTPLATLRIGRKCFDENEHNDDLLHSVLKYMVFSPTYWGGELNLDDFGPKFECQGELFIHL